MNNIEADRVIDLMLEELETGKPLKLNKSPKVGEYWYTSHGIRRVLGVCDRGVVVRSQSYLVDFTTIEINYLLCRWEPNWFWRILGYV